MTFRRSLLMCTVRRQLVARSLLLSKNCWATTITSRPICHWRGFASRPHHDIGGALSSFGTIPELHDLQAWERQCHSLFAVLATKKILSTDALRRSIEALTPAQYEAWTYYEKWSAAMTSLLLDAKVLTQDELSSVLFGADNNNNNNNNNTMTTPLFQTGDAVRVKPFSSGTEFRRPHTRTPGYVYGVAGVVERVCGRHGDPSFLAFGLEAPAVQLYRVRFRQNDIWPEQEEASTIDDVVEVEVYEHWLEPSDRTSGHSFGSSALFNHGEGDDCVHHRNEHDEQDAHEHHHHHHNDDDDDHAHVHEARPVVERRAIEREGAPSPGKQLHDTLMKLLVEKSVVTANEVRRMTEGLDAAGQRLDGADLVVKAWQDPAFEQRLLQDAPAAASEIGISTANANAPTILTVVKNTLTTHNLIVCTLCSCYPSGLLGIAPSWYKSSEYRSRAVREPRAVLREFGLDVSKETSIRVHDSTADHRYLILPQRPPGTDNWSDDKLRTLVTRDSMLGVAVPSSSLGTTESV